MLVIWGFVLAFVLDALVWLIFSPESFWEKLVLSVVMLIMTGVIVGLFSVVYFTVTDFDEEKDSHGRRK